MKATARVGDGGLCVWATYSLPCAVFGLHARQSLRRVIGASVGEVMLSKNSPGGLWTTAAVVLQVSLSSLSRTQLAVGHLQDVHALSMAAGPTRLTPPGKSAFF